MKIFYILLMVLLIQISFVEAWGVGGTYSNNYPLYLSPGESVDLSARLQNVAPSDKGKNIILRVRPFGDSIGKLLDNKLDYSVPFGNKNSLVNIRISVPKNARDGNKYNFGIVVKEIRNSKKGFLDVGVETSYNFPIIVREKVSLSPVENHDWIILIVVGVILVFLIYLGIRRHKLKRAIRM